MSANPRGLPNERNEKFLPELWQARISWALCEKIREQSPKLMMNYEGQAKRQGDIVWFVHRSFPIYGHGVTLNRIKYFYRVIRMDPVRIQIDSDLMKRTVEHLSEMIFEDLHIPDTPALFAGQVVDLQEKQLGYHLGPGDDDDFILQGNFIYGYVGLSPIRSATEIIARCKKEGLSHAETIKELERFF